MFTRAEQEEETENSHVRNGMGRNGSGSSMQIGEKGEWDGLDSGRGRILTCVTAQLLLQTVVHFSVHI